MGDIKLFRTNGAAVSAIQGHSVTLERSLQTLIERNLDVFLGVRFLETEYSTGKTHGGRIDTLGIDEYGCPVIIEYKRSTNENVINQGLYYLDWLFDHKADFELLVQRKPKGTVIQEIDWSSPRLLCIAGDFTKYDIHAVKQINRNVELLRYIRFGEDLLLLELVNAVQATQPTTTRIEVASSAENKPKQKGRDKTVAEQLAQASAKLMDIYETLKSTLVGMGDDVQVKMVQQYVAFKRIKNFASIDVRATQEELFVYVKVNPDTVALEPGFTRDVRDIGIWGTGGLEITIRSYEDIQKAMPLFVKSYEAS